MWNGPMITTCMSCRHEQLLVQCLCICLLKAQPLREKFYRIEKAKKALYGTGTDFFVICLFTVSRGDTSHLTSKTMLLSSCVLSKNK